MASILSRPQCVTTAPQSQGPPVIKPDIALQIILVGMKTWNKEFPWQLIKIFAHVPNYPDLFVLYF